MELANLVRMGRSALSIAFKDPAEQGAGEQPYEEIEQNCHQNTPYTSKKNLPCKTHCDQNLCAKKQAHERSGETVEQKRGEERLPAPSYEAAIRKETYKEVS